MGGEGGAFGAVAGAALIELIRNSLLLLGVDPYWQGAFVGARSSSLCLSSEFDAEAEPAG